MVAGWYWYKLYIAAQWGLSTISNNEEHGKTIIIISK